MLMKSLLLRLRRGCGCSPATTATATGFLAAAALSSTSVTTTTAAAAAAAAFTTATTTPKTGRSFIATRNTNRIINTSNIVRRQQRRQVRSSLSSSSSSSSMSSSSTTATDAVVAKQQQEQNDIKLMQDILYRVRDTNHMPSDIQSSLIEFRLDDGMLLGKTCPKTAELLCKTGSNDVFVMSSDEGYLTLSEDVVGGTDCESRTKAVGQVMEQLRDDGIIKGWRNEMLPVVSGFYDNDPPKFLIERAAAPLLATTEYGVHINGIVYDNATNDNEKNDNANNNIRMWIGRRSKTKSKYPGMLDHIVAGGQPSGISLVDNVLKECMEEAGIPENLVKQGLKSAGAVSYETYNPPNDNYSVETITRSVLYCYDLVLPATFQPRPVDGEVDEFVLCDINDTILQKTMDPSYPDPIKPNCYLVIIDFLIRHGYLNPDVPGYLDVLRGLRSGDCR